MRGAVCGDEREGGGECQGAFQKDRSGAAGYGRGGGSDGRGESEYVAYDESVYTKCLLTKSAVIDVNINPSKPESNEGCAC